MFLKSLSRRFSPILFLGVALLSTGAIEAAQNSDCCPSNCPEAPQCGLGYNPSAYPQCGNQANCGVCDNLSGRFDILYWRPCSEGLQLGKQESLINSQVGNEAVLTDVSRASELDFKFDTGFRLGLGYYSPCDCCDAALNWTHFHSKASAEGFSNPIDGTYFISNWVRELGANTLLTDSRWTLDLDLLDLEFAKTYFVNHCFILRPFIGLRAARIDQGYHVNSKSSVSSGEIQQTFDSHVKASSDFRGIGPRAGFCAEIRLGCGISLVGGAAASLVFGTFDRHSLEKQRGSLLGSSEFNYDAHGGGPSRCTVTMADLGIGLKWEHCFECCGNMHPFAFTVAWEHHGFYDLNHFNFVAGGTTEQHVIETGDLTTQGITFSAMLGF